MAPRRLFPLALSLCGLALTASGCSRSDPQEQALMQPLTETQIQAEIQKLQSDTQLPPEAREARIRAYQQDLQRLKSQSASGTNP